MPNRQQKKADQYNDPKHNYLHYWDGRQYEHASEELALKRLLKGKHFHLAVDIGGGYGRLSRLLSEFADEVVLAEPSKQQLDIARDYLAAYPQIKRQLMQADALKFPDSSVDLAVMIRVMHHLPDPSQEFAEVARVLKPGGLFVLEAANYAHARNRLKHVLRGKRLPAMPVDIRSAANRNKDEIAFVNHNPKTVIKQLAHAGFRVEKVLSVSNLRSPSLKKIVPKPAMLSAERLMQPLLAKVYFGPSIFFLVQKVPAS